MALVIKGGRLLDPAQGIDRIADLYIDDHGRIAETLTSCEYQTIDATGKWVCVGLCDLAVRVPTPGMEYKEDFQSIRAAGIAGGFTKICVLPTSEPILDSRSVLEHLQTLSQNSSLKISFYGAISQKRRGELLSEYAELSAGGIIGLSDDRTIKDAGFMRRVLEYASTFNLCVFAHCEDPAIAGKWAMHEGVVSTQLGLPAAAAEAESSILARDLELVRLTGARYHAQRISTSRSVELIREAKEKGLSISADVAIASLCLLDEACRDYDSRTKLRPPLRSKEHQDALIGGLKDGTIDAIVSNHQPQIFDDKEVEYGLAGFGGSTLEVTLAAALTLKESHGLDESLVLNALSTHPERIIGMTPSTLKYGDTANLIVVDPNLEWRVLGDGFKSKSKYTPFENVMLKGKVIHTVIEGNVVNERDDR